MQVDNVAADIPSLQTYLSLCTTYPSATSKGIVLGLKKWVRDPEDAVAIAQVLESWIWTLVQQRKAGGELGLLPSNKDLEKNEHGVWVFNEERRAKRGKESKKSLPPLPKVCSPFQVKRMRFVLSAVFRLSLSFSHSWMRASFNCSNTRQHTSCFKSSKLISWKKYRSPMCWSNCEGRSSRLRLATKSLSRRQLSQRRRKNDRGRRAIGGKGGMGNLQLLARSVRLECTSWRSWCCRAHGVGSFSVNLWAYTWNAPIVFWRWCLCLTDIACTRPISLHSPALRPVPYLPSALVHSRYTSLNRVSF